MKRAGSCAMMVLRHARPLHIEHDRLDGEASDRVGIEPRPISGFEMNGAFRERQRRVKQAIVWLQEAVEPPGIADGRASDRGLQPAMDLAAKAIAQHRLQAAGAHALES